MNDPDPKLEYLDRLWLKNTTKVCLGITSFTTLVSEEHVVKEHGPQGWHEARTWYKVEENGEIIGRKDFRRHRGRKINFSVRGTLTFGKSY